MIVGNRTSLLALAPALFACTPPLNDKVAVPPDLPSVEGRQFVMPDTIIPTGEERMVCWIPDWVPDQDYQVVSLEPLQGSFGHHLVALVSATPRQAGTVFDCTEAESMASLRPLIIPERAGQAPLLPAGFAVRLPRDARIVFQSHYVNSSERDLLVGDVARIHYAAPGSNPTEAGYFILNSTSMDVAPSSPGSISVTCSPPQRIQALALMGHMHWYGRSLSLTRTPAGGPAETIYQVDTWQPSYRDLPPVTAYSPSSPLVMEATDSFTLTCNYENPTGDRVRFPTEMCTAISYYFPALATPLVLCD